MEHGLEPGAQHGHGGRRREDPGHPVDRVASAVRSSRGERTRGSGRRGPAGARRWRRRRRCRRAGRRRERTARDGPAPVRGRCHGAVARGQTAVHLGRREGCVEVSRAAERLLVRPVGGRSARGAGPVSGGQATASSRKNSGVQRCGSASGCRRSRNTVTHVIQRSPRWWRASAPLPSTRRPRLPVKRPRSHRVEVAPRIDPVLSRVRFRRHRGRRGRACGDAPSARC